MPVSLCPAIGLAVERERKPELNGQPLALVRDGVLCAVSGEAERFGIKPGQKASGAYSLCENLTVTPYQVDIYEVAVRPLWNACAIESCIVEPGAPETCFVELSGRDQEMRARLLLAGIARRIPATVYCGLAGSKFVAAEASRAAFTQPQRVQSSGAQLAVRSEHVRKSPPPQPLPRGERNIALINSEQLREAYATVGEECSEQFLLIPPGREAVFLDTVTIPVLLLDAKAMERLEKLGVRTLGDIRRLPSGELERQIKQAAVRLRKLAVGEHRESVRALWPPRTLEHRIDFEDEVTSSDRIEQAVLRCSKRIAYRLAPEYARTVRLIVYLAERTKRSVAERPATPIQAVAGLHTVSLRLLERLALAAPVSGVRLIVGDLSIGSARQLQLLDQNQNLPGLPHERQESLETTRLFLTARYGCHALTLASAAVHHRQIDFTLTALGRRCSEPINVNTEHEAPVCFSFRNHSHSILRVLDRWKLSECSGDTVAELSAFRVLFDRTSIADLEQSAVGWRMVGVSD